MIEKTENVKEILEALKQYTSSNPEMMRLISGAMVKVEEIRSDLIAIKNNF